MTAARQVLLELAARLEAGDTAVVDELIAQDMVNHAAGPQGRDGWREILRTIEDDLGPTRLEHHEVVAEDDLVTTRLTVHGVHRGSSMPLLHGVPVSGAQVSWESIHIWRVRDGQIVEHWACRDDVGLLRQVDAWPAGGGAPSGDAAVAGERRRPA